MEGSMKDVSRYRLENARNNLSLAIELLSKDDLRYAMNRSYYAIFHALRAVNCLDGFDSSKHKGVISYFNREHIKTGDFPSEVSKMISSAMEIRQKSDYEDFYVVSREAAKMQIKNAEYIIGLIEGYIGSKFGEDFSIL